MRPYGPPAVRSNYLDRMLRVGFGMAGLLDTEYIYDNGRPLTFHFEERDGKENIYLAI